MPASRPNVLFLLSDEHSFRFLGHRADEPALTPALDRLAAAGTVFSDAYCQMPLCTPSRICLLTAPRRWFDSCWPDRVTEPKIPARGRRPRRPRLSRPSRRQKHRYHRRRAEPQGPLFRLVFPPPKQ